MNGSMKRSCHLANEITTTIYRQLYPQTKAHLMHQKASSTFSKSSENLLIIKPVGVTSKKRFIGALNMFLIMSEWNLLPALKIM